MDNILPWFNIAVLFLRLVLIFGQLHLSSKINKQNISRERGYFLLCKTTMTDNPDLIAEFRDRYDLHKPLKFYVAGNSDIIVKGSFYNVDGREHLNPVPT